jgi:hypothetical protein
MQGDAQRKTPSGGAPEPIGPITMRNAGDAERNKETPQRDRMSGERKRNSVTRVINASSEESFPASDPPSWSPTTAGSPCGDEPCDDEDEGGVGRD